MPSPNKKNHTCSKCGYDPNKNETWDYVYAQWKLSSVKQIEVLNYNSELHEALPWFHKAKKYAVYLNANPKNNTAHHLVRGIVNANDEIYAAFALTASLRQDRFFNNRNREESRDLSDVVLEALHNMDTRKVMYWTSNAKNVLPHVDSQNLVAKAVHERSDCWCDYINASAKMWNEMASEWSVLRFPPDWGPRY